MVTNWKIQLALVVSAVSLSTGAVVAQTPATEDEEAAEIASRLEQITVQGTKIEQRLQDVAASVDVTTAQEIAREPVDDLYQIIERVPNVISAFGEQGFAIRGIDQRGIGGGGRGNTITTYVDDSPLGNFTSFFGPTGAWDLGQVEVYRGPQSTNFGRNALAGAIYVRTRDPQYEADFRARVEAAEFGTRQVAVAGGGALIDNRLAVRVAASARDSDGFIDNTFLGEPADDAEIRSGRVKFLFEPTASFSLLTTTSYEENGAGEDGLPADTAFDREVAYDTDGREGTESFIQSINADWLISDTFELQSITTYQDTDYVRIEDQDSSPLPLARLDRTGTADALTQEFRLKYFGDRIRGVLGAYYVDTSDGFDDSLTIPLAALFPDFGLTNILTRGLLTDNDETNYALFADAEIFLTDRFSLLTGFRYDVEDQESVFNQTVSVAGAVPPQLQPVLDSVVGQTVQVSEADFDAFLPKLGVQFEVSNDWTLALVAQRAYRAGGAEVNLATGALNEFDPEYLINYEVSSRRMLFDGALSWNLNAFYADWTDQQVSVPASPELPTLVVTVNAGESTLYGLETDFTWYASSELELYGGIGLVHTEFDDFPNPLPLPGQPDNYAGNEFFFAPNLTANLGVDYQHSNGFFAGVDINYQSELYSDIDNIPVNELSSRTLVNARVGYRFADHYRFSVYVRNAFDEEYFQFLDRDGTTNFARVGDPQVFGARLDLEF